jgi:hypothetical protein
LLLPLLGAASSSMSLPEPPISQPSDSIDRPAIIQRQPHHINDDILVRILIEIVAEDWNRIRKAKKGAYLVRCTHVCRYWRAIALSTPVLWQFIPIWLTYTAKRETSWFSELRARYERSQGSNGLYMLIRKAPSACFTLGFDTVFDSLIYPNIHRYREIIILHDDETIYTLLEHGSSLRALKVLSIHVIRGKSPIPEGSTEYRLTNNHTPPFLEDFSLHNRSPRFKIDPSFYGSNLKKLCLRDDCETLDETHKILAMVASAIEDLKVGISRNSTNLPPSLSPICCPKLTNLAVHCFPTFLNEGIPIFSSFEVFGDTGEGPLHLPSLRSCVVATPPEWLAETQEELYAQGVLKFISRLPASVSILQFQSMPPGRTGMWPYILKELASIKGTSTPRTFILPKLQTMAFHSCISIDEVDVRRLMRKNENGTCTQGLS